MPEATEESGCPPAAAAGHGAGHSLPLPCSRPCRGYTATLSGNCFMFCLGFCFPALPSFFFHLDITVLVDWV